MMKKHNLLLASTVAILPLVPSCEEKQPSGQPEEPKAAEAPTPAQENEYLQRGDKASKALMASLGSKLKAAMKSGGPENALTICQQLAMPSTDAVSADFAGLTISRVSNKPRNPKNQPGSLDQEVLTAWEKQLASGEAKPADVVRYKEDQTAVFYRPIMTQGICLKCHGDPSTFSEGLATKLKKAYPGDKATGYRAGQLRGAFRVEFSGE